jgi:acyl carrier protein
MPMTNDQAFELIKKALLKAVPKTKSYDLQFQDNLIKDGIIDSLDSMAFLYELEALCQGPLEAIDHHFNDFRVQRLVEIVSSADATNAK